MPSAPIGCDRFTWPRSTALPISALSTLLRTEASGVLAAVSPHCATTAPRCTTITAVEPICRDQASAFASFSRDQPVDTWFDMVPIPFGETVDDRDLGGWARGQRSAHKATVSHSCAGADAALGSKFHVQLS